MIRYIGRDKKTISDQDNPENLRKLFWNQDDISVIHGKGIGTSLTEDTIRETLGLLTTSV